MTTWNPRANDLFLKALELHSADERRKYLDEACAGEAALRAEVESLLEASARAGGFLESPAAAGLPSPSPRGRGAGGEGLGPTRDDPITERPGAIIGPYKLIEQIGEGGMGTVWMAQQTEPVKRLVAVKLIKAGMDSRQVIARFEAERQALALMDHANIAKVLDAGTTDAGRPYFVMDLVKGVPITKYCDEHHLTPRQRLELFIPVCQAIQHAHQKGIIHRDLKPSNVVVALYDGKPVPKVIDFGVAKAAGQTLTQKTLVTGFGTIVGTLEYMSPEQAEINQLDIDTRSDIYSLGVLLYELLTGGPPFSKKELEKVGMLEMLRVIREQEPTKPSTKLSTAEGLPTLAANRGTEPAKLTKLMRGELDWIVMKALEKDRNRRYETANALARDLQRYLADEVVEARPPGAGYRLRKFVKRNRGPVAAASLIVLLLLGGIAGTTTGLMIARHQRDEAERARLDEAREAARAIAAEKLASSRLAQVESEKQRADEERAVAQAVNDFLQKDLLGQVDPGSQPGGARPRDPEIKVRTVLDRAAKTIGARFANKPRVEAAIRLTIANGYYALGNWPEARLHAERSVELHTANLGAANSDTLNAKRFLALVLHDMGEIHRAQAVLVDIVQQQTETLGPNHRDTLLSQRYLAYSYMMRIPPEPDRAEEIMLDVVRRCAELHGPSARVTLENKISLAWAYRQQGKLDRAEAMHVELHDAFRDRFGADNATTLLIRSNLGLVKMAQGKLDQAEPHLQYVLDKCIPLYGKDHPNTLGNQCYLAMLYRKQRQYEKAVRLFEPALEKYREKPEFYEATLVTLSDLAQTHLEAKQVNKALPLIAEFIRRQHEQSDPETLFCAGELADIGLLLAKNEQYLEAEKHLRRSLAIHEKKAPDRWSTFNTQSILGAALMGQKKYADAEPLLIKGYEGMKQRADKILAPDRVRLTEALERLVQFNDAWGKPDEAAKWRKELEKRKEKP